MQDETPETPSVGEQLRNLAVEHFGWMPRGLMEYSMAPFDISRPNIHNSKREFQLEYDTVKGIVQNLDAICDLLASDPESESAEHTEMFQRLRHDIDVKGFKKNQREIIDTAPSLAMKNVRDSGFFLTSLYVIMDMNDIYLQRLTELEDQKSQFWSVSSRPPNYYARAIALRFARFYAQQTGTKPTYGTSRDGPHPSTDFGRLLEEVFSILGIKVNIRGPAEYAISQITDEDIGGNGLGGMGLAKRAGLELNIKASTQNKTAASDRLRTLENVMEALKQVNPKLFTNFSPFFERD